VALTGGGVQRRDTQKGERPGGGAKVEGTTAKELVLLVATSKDKATWKVWNESENSQTNSRKKTLIELKKLQ
jgi:hypothetical protein